MAEDDTLPTSFPLKENPIRGINEEVERRETVKGRIDQEKIVLESGEVSLLGVMFC